MIYLQLLIFVFGLLIGSFLNVVIHRLPKGQSVTMPRSRCPRCNTLIKWYQNIPVASYLFLRGRCSQCKEKISWRYPLIELMTGIIAVLLFPSEINFASPNPALLARFAVQFSIACAFLAHFVIDIKHQLLPDKINLYLLAVIAPYVILNYPLGHWLLGGLIGFFGPYLITLFFLKLRGQIGLGGGDIKLFGVLGVLLGPMGVMSLIFMSSFLGSVVGIAMIAFKKMNRDTALAFGPYIIVVAACQIFFPDFFAAINPFSFN